MEYRWLGSSGIKVSSLALGAMGFGGATTGGWVGNHELDDVRRHVGMALDAGVILFDSANSYQKGTAEELLGKALGSQRDHVLVSTKVNSRVGEGINDVGQSRWHIMRVVRREPAPARAPITSTSTTCTGSTPAHRWTSRWPRSTHSCNRARCATSRVRTMPRGR